MTLTIHIGKFWKFLQCPFATWWKCRKYFKRPRFKFYFGPMQKRYKVEGLDKFAIKSQHLYRDTGFIYFVSTDYIRWKTTDWFPILMESRDISWKDKYNTPRYEHPGFFSIIFGRNPRTAWQFAMIVKAPEIYHLKDGIIKEKIYEDCYWESMLWYNNYYKDYKSEVPDLKKAYESKTECLSTINGYYLDINDFNKAEVEYSNKVYVDLYKEVNVYEPPFTDGISNMDRVMIKTPKTWVHSEFCLLTSDDECNHTFHCLFRPEDAEECTTDSDFTLFKHIPLYKCFNQLLLTDKGLELIKLTIMDNTKKKLIEALGSLENIYFDCMDVYTKEVAKHREESEEVKNILISFTDLINNIKYFKKNSSE